MKQKGFNLIELLITMAIIGILAAVAYPAYTGYVTVARREDAKAALVTLASAMERKYSINSTYAGLAGVGGVPLTTVYSVPSGIAKNYDITITDADSDTFTISATPKGGQADDACGTLTLTNTSVTGGDIDGCW